MNKIDFSKRVFVSITGETDKHRQDKVEEINRKNIKEAAVFLERFDKNQRQELYASLKESSLGKVPFVHLRNDNSKEEIEFFIKNYGTEYFNIHESGFGFLGKWSGFESNLYLEMNYDDTIKESVKVKKIGGFCIDLAHFKTSEIRKTEEYKYVLSKKNNIDFACNHIGAYDKENRRDSHYVTDINQFDYLADLPEFIFGQVMAIEVDNSIEEQLKFRDYIIDILDKKFN